MESSESGSGGGGGGHWRVFVGDLSPEVTPQMLSQAFEAYGQLSDAKVIRDGTTMRSKGYGFVSFVEKEAAEKAMEEMSGQCIGRRPVRTNWASRKPPTAAKTYEEVYAATSTSNTTVYVGGVPTSAGEAELRLAFEPFGEIHEVRQFRHHGYAFIRYAAKESAAAAIVSVNGEEIAGAFVRCSWGRQPDAYSQQGGGGGNSGPVDATGAWQQFWHQYYPSPALLHHWYSQHGSPTHQA